MSKRLDVIAAVKALIKTALPAADVRGLDDETAKPDHIAPGGTVIVRAGDPGEPEIDLSPLTYNFDHAIPLELGAYHSEGLTSEEVLDGMLGAIGAAVEADRTLGGLCIWLDVGAAATDDFDEEGAETGRWADVEIRALYATSNPLT